MLDQPFLSDELVQKRQDLYSRLDQVATAPLWSVMSKLVTATPQPASVPAVWSYQVMRRLLLEAGGLISAKEAERRVLILENPGIRGMSQITQSLYAGLQMILPGEIAPSHRHAASALRFVIEGEGGYTAVDGERITMHPGDFIITPSWTFHDHGNNGDTPVIWLDGLDVPMVNLFDASFAQGYPGGEVQALTRPENDASARYSQGLAPVEYVHTSTSSPLFHYPYSTARAALDTLYRNGPVNPWHGVKLQYINPTTGGPAMPTMGAFIQLYQAGFVSRPYRSTDASVFCVKQGSGVSHIGGTLVPWEAGDVFMVPSWSAVIHEVQQDAVLFSFSDRPAQKVLGLWREEQMETTL
ncbi:gentisate 1,2-dioxygenase [Glaciimonas sp. PAMC28666]|uniref:gentisate 1,2-dioxygenase n=1 Tax=Glaciimonas sp. PAMC28666 TaxID=2807626 RepID=UPI0019629E02|nr:gentisate 1,2-dioxygenase [Glaciimonas sp. PAMC28666]QRX81811.1 gentisate 1,2-dioxygenase [Glaciimonas sp. PAMC28666]